MTTGTLLLIWHLVALLAGSTICGGASNETTTNTIQNSSEEGIAEEVNDGGHGDDGGGGNDDVGDDDGGPRSGGNDDDDVNPEELFGCQLGAYRASECIRKIHDEDVREIPNDADILKRHMCGIMDQITRECFQAFHRDGGNLCSHDREILIDILYQTMSRFRSKDRFCEST